MAVLAIRNWAVVTGVCLLIGSGCHRGYKTAEDLDSDDRGPQACAKSCSDLGMQMSAFVLVEHGTSGCVCAPTGPAPAGPPAAAAAAHVMLEQERQQQQAAAASASQK